MIHLNCHFHMYFYICPDFYEPVLFFFVFLFFFIYNLDGENAIGLGGNRGLEATEPVRACRGGGKEPVVARIGLDADAFDRDGVGERGHPDREVRAVLAHMEAEVGHADDAAAAPAGVDIGGVDAWRRVDDIGREADVRRGY